jgi:hypothetical protein
MFDALSRVLGIEDLSKHKPQINRINHWEDGLPAKTPPNSRGCLFDIDVGIGWCGDFCTTPGIEGAAKSGREMAIALSAFMSDSKAFDHQGYLPADEEWIPFQLSDESTLLDIGSFSSNLNLKPHPSLSRKVRTRARQQPDDAVTPGNERSTQNWSGQGV